MKTYQIVLLVIAGFIAGFLVAKLAKRNRNGKSGTPSNSGTATNTSTDTGTGIPIDPNSAERKGGCTPFIPGIACPPGKNRKLVNGKIMCC